MRSVLDRYNGDLALRYVGRPASAAPAAGYMSAHLEEQAKFVNEALSF
jgi:2-oxoglutarate dehydrogenase E1 component